MKTSDTDTQFVSLATGANLPSSNPQFANLSFNITSAALFIAGSNPTVQVQILLGAEPMWTVQVSQNSPSVACASDQKLGSATLTAGSSVSLQLVGPTIIVSFSGTLIDGASESTTTGQQIATFQTSTQATDA